MTDLTPWNNPRSYLPNLEDQLGIVEHYEKLARQAVRKANWKRRVKAFCIAVAADVEETEDADAKYHSFRQVFIDRLAKVDAALAKARGEQ